MYVRIENIMSKDFVCYTRMRVCVIVQSIYVYILKRITITHKKYAQDCAKCHATSTRIVRVT